ncbi:hypothetical protein VPNG_03922 [Cytospora leucostoma]|uniref:Protein-lysine N-methyltransferase EFM4 n=1 Tax=Cytospora leucostoma TaxID=1230097 RepID=A0A423XE08_9PEZI|nr:hypothetical protein VPNG_03922 [Cytospora leucostoma]
MAGAPSSIPTHLEPSKLGTKEYWDNLYTTELTNHSHDPSDKGTVWFDDSDAETKVLEFLEDLAEEASSPSSYPASPTSTDHEESQQTQQQPQPQTKQPQQQQQPPQLDKETTSFLDLGCGNGSFLFALRAEGWQGPCLGVDYSERSVALARQIAASEGQQDEVPVGFDVWDVLRGPYGTVLETKETTTSTTTTTEDDKSSNGDGWDVVHDKGTFDAISLSEEADEAGRRICEGYKGRVVRLVRPGGFFLVTSCNWTEEELEGWFGEGSAEVEGGSFVRVGRVNYPSFSFGGVKGQTISTVCYQRR